MKSHSLRSRTVAAVTSAAALTALVAAPGVARADRKETLAEQPIVTYHQGYTGRARVDLAFALAGLVFIKRMSESAAMRPREEHIDTPRADRMVYHLEGPYFFGAAAQLGGVLDRIAEAPRSYVMYMMSASGPVVRIKNQPSSRVARRGLLRMRSSSRVVGICMEAS